MGCGSSKSDFIIKMSSKTILIGLTIFRCGSERSESLHGRPSREFAPYRRNA